MESQKISRENAVMGEVDYSNLPYILSLFVLVLSLCKYLKKTLNDQ